jgi:hypothetical protein
MSSEDNEYVMKRPNILVDDCPDCPFINVITYLKEQLCMAEATVTIEDILEIIIEGKVII